MQIWKLLLFQNQIILKFFCIRSFNKLSLHKHKDEVSGIHMAHKIF